MKEKQHLYEIDLMRSFIILGVTCVHVISFYSLFENPYSGSGLTFGALLMASHYSREAFMLMTGLVLFITYYNRPFKAISFWKKRFILIFIPYAAWTLIYILFSNTYLKDADWSITGILHNFFISLLVGKQFYLYFLVVSMQLYAVFPLMVVLLKRCYNWHGWVFVGSFALQMWMMWLNKEWIQDMDTSHLPYWLAELLKYRDRWLITYQFWFISGALMAIHYPKVKAYFERHSKLIYVVLAFTFVGLWSYYAVEQVALHKDVGHTTLVLQPVMIPYGLVVTLTFWNLGLKWAKVRLEPRLKLFSSFVKVVAKASFGVFLVHPLVLHYVEVAVYTWHPSHALRIVMFPISILVVYGVSIVIVRCIASVPLLSYIVGIKTQLPKLTPREVTRTP
jgi:peptidoglycan/LPS O-acetylase OafA/YrhL